VKRRRHVLMVAERDGCTRVHKESAALAARGWKVDLLTRFPATDWAVYRHVYSEQHTARPDDWAEAIASCRASIVHYHNEPDKHMRAVVEGAGRRPVVYDVHDMTLFKQGLTLDSEFAFANASAVVHVSPEIRDAAWSIFPHPPAVAVVENYPLRSVIDIFPEARPGRGVVYVGGMVRERSDSYWRHRYFDDVDAAFGKAGVPVAWYSRSAPKTSVRDPRTWLPYGLMLNETAGYSWGLVGSEVKRILQPMASPNKAWEYVALGLPVLSLNQPRLERLLDGEAGVYGETVDELVDGMRAADWHELHRQARARRRFMDAEIVKLEELYGRLA
jgi:hypothetical protein